MRVVNVLGVLIFIIGFLQVAEAQCKKPKDEDSPHGANEFILLKQRRVRRIHGQVWFPNYMIEAGKVRAESIVVELYTYKGSDSYDDVSRVLREQKRVAACLTGAAGRFYFTGLKPGRYLLRAGTRERNEYNEVHAIFILDFKRGTRAGIEIILPAGT